MPWCNYTKNGRVSKEILLCRAGSQAHTTHRRQRLDVLWPAPPRINSDGIQTRTRKPLRCAGRCGGRSRSRPMPSIATGESGSTESSIPRCRCLSSRSIYFPVQMLVADSGNVVPVKIAVSGSLPGSVRRGQLRDARGQCLLKKRSISCEASGPLGSVNEP